MLSVRILVTTMPLPPRMPDLTLSIPYRHTMQLSQKGQCSKLDGRVQTPVTRVERPVYALIALCRQIQPINTEV